MRNSCRSLFLLFVLSTFFLFSKAQDTLNKTDVDKETVFTIVEVMPQFPGGEEAMMKFISQNIKYPFEARKKEITGRVYIKFVIDKNGDLTHPKVLRGIGGGCDEEALRVIMLMPKWVPATQGGIPVSVYFNLPINFMLR